MWTWTFWFGKRSKVFKGIPNIIWPIFTRKIEISIFIVWWPTNQNFKNRFFSIFAKSALITIYTSSIVSGHSPGLQRPISGHISHFRPLLEYKKNRKNWVFWYFCKIYLCHLMYIVAGTGRKWPGGKIVTKNTFS